MNPWSEEAVATLKRLREQNKPYSVIASVLGVSVRAVTGKVDRLGLPPRDTSQSAAFARWGDRKAKGRPTPPSFPAPVPEPHMTPVGLMDRTGCAWPVNDGGPYLFCNQPRQENSDYCTHHFQRSRRLA